MKQLEAQELDVMGKVEYKILAYAHSVVEVQVVDILLVLRLATGEGPKLRAFLRSDWTHVAAEANAATRRYLELLVFELRQRLVDGSADDDDFFDALEAFSSGTLRTSASGSFQLIDVRALHPFLDSDTGIIRYLDPAMMGSTIETINSRAMD